MSKCARPGCPNTGKNRFSGCLREPYCSSDCQKLDWKSHKLICKSLKKLSDQFQPYQVVLKVIKEVIIEELSRKKLLGIRGLEHLITYAKCQFGDRIQGKSYRARANGERIDNYIVEIDILYAIYATLVSIYTREVYSMGMIDLDNLCFPHLENMLDLLKPWSTLICGSTNQTDGIICNSKINYLLFAISQT
jgi:hypothetical protein